MTRSPKPKNTADIRSISFPERINVEGDLKIKTPESNSDRLHRHRMEVRRYWTQEVPANLTAIGIIISSALVAIVWAFRPNSAPDDKKGAVSVLSYLLVATAGFAFSETAKQFSA